jgi:hypothetical protein
MLFPLFRASDEIQPDQMKVLHAPAMFFATSYYIDSCPGKCGEL